MGPFQPAFYVRRVLSGTLILSLHLQRSLPHNRSSKGLLLEDLIFRFVVIFMPITITGPMHRISSVFRHGFTRENRGLARSSVRA